MSCKNSVGNLISRLLFGPGLGVHYCLHCYSILTNSPIRDSSQYTTWFTCKTHAEFSFTYSNKKMMVLHLHPYQVHVGFLLFPRSWWPGLPHESSEACCQSLESCRSAARAVVWGPGGNWSHTPAYSWWPCSLPPRGTLQVVKSCTTTPNPQKPMWCSEEPCSGPK